MFVWRLRLQAANGGPPVCVEAGALACCICIFLRLFARMVENPVVVRCIDVLHLHVAPPVCAVSEMCSICELHLRVAPLVGADGWIVTYLSLWTLAASSPRRSVRVGNIILHMAHVYTGCRFTCESHCKIGLMCSALSAKCTCAHPVIVHACHGGIRFPLIA